MRRPQVARALQKIWEIRLVQPGEIKIAAAFRQIVPGNPKTSVQRLSACDGGFGIRTLSLSILCGNECDNCAAGRLQKIATPLRCRFMTLCHRSPLCRLAFVLRTLSQRRTSSAQPHDLCHSERARAFKLSRACGSAVKKGARPRDLLFPAVQKILLPLLGIRGYFNVRPGHDISHSQT